MFNSAKVVAFSTVLSFGVIGCHGKPAADVVATVNSHPITTGELDRAYNDHLGDAPENQKPSGEERDSLRLGLLKQMIEEEIIQQRAAKMNLTATPEEVDAKLAAMKAPYSEDEFQSRIAARKLTVDDIKRDLRRALTTNKLLNKEINSRISVSSSDINNYYNAHKNDFNNIETQWHIAQILVTNKPAQAGNLQGSKATSDAEARRKIAAIKNRVDSGEDFGTLAMNLSENPTTAVNQGDMGSVPESQLRTNQVVFLSLEKLKPGQTTDIIPFPDPADPKSIGGYAIFQLISRDPAGQHTVAEPQIEQRIRQGLTDARSQLLKVAYYEMIRDQAKVENYEAERIFKADAH